MLDSARLLPLAHHLPVLFDGAGLHRAALQEMTRGRWAAADRLFESAAVRYRADLQVEPLARLRVHQLMARVRSGVLPEPEAAELVLEVDSRLCRLGRIESLDSPFAFVHARTLLASWLPDAGGASRLAA